MATKWQFLALLLLASLVQAATLEDFITPYLYSGENYSRDVSPAQFDAGSAHYVLVGIRGHDAFLLNRTLAADNSTAYSFVNDTEAMFQILRLRNSNATVPNQSRIDAISALIDKFQSSRNPRESDCKHVTGVGMGRSCTLARCDACMTVPICSLLMPQWGDDFVLSIIYFDANLTMIDASIANARSNLSLATNESYDSTAMLDNAAAEVGKAIIYSHSILSNRLFGCDEQLTWCTAPTRDPHMLYCQQIPYNITALQMAQANATALKATVVTNSSLRSQAQALYTATNTRALDRILRAENATFSEFVSLLHQKEANVSASADAVLLYVSDEGLRADVGLLDELLLNVSQFGLDRNYTAANATTSQFHVLAAKIDARTRELNGAYSEVLSANETATLALFRAQLVLEPQDYALRSDLQQYSIQKEAMDQLLAGKIAPGDLDGARDDLRYLAARADAITASKRGQRVQQVGVWLGTVARVASGYIIGAISAVTPLSPTAKEGYARSLPTLVMTLLAAFVYIGCLALFGLLAYKRRIQLNRVALILWAIIFMFLFILTGIGTITANSLVQQQVSRSTFDLFSRSVDSSPTSVIVISAGGAGSDSLTIMRSCADSLGANLTALGKSAASYEFVNETSCTSGNLTRSISECQAEFNDYPVFILSPGNETSTSFYVYYAKQASLQGNDTFYSQCLISRVFG